LPVCQRDALSRITSFLASNCHSARLLDAFPSLARLLSTSRGKLDCSTVSLARRTLAILLFLRVLSNVGHHTDYQTTTLVKSEWCTCLSLEYTWRSGRLQGIILYVCGEQCTITPSCLIKLHYYRGPLDNCEKCAGTKQDHQFERVCQYLVHHKLQ